MGKYEPHKMVHVTGGALVRNDVLNIVEKIRAYDDNLDVMYLDPSQVNEVGDAPYMIVEKCKDGYTRVVFSVWELDERVLDRIYMADMHRVDVLGRLDLNNYSVRLSADRRFKEEILPEAHDIMKSAMKAPTSFKFRNNDGELVTLEDDKGVVKREG